MRPASSTSPAGPARATSRPRARWTAGTSATRSATTGRAATPSWRSTVPAAPGSCTSRTSRRRREDRAEAVAADAQGNAYVTGYTMSPNFPVAHALQPDWRCGSVYGDAFVVKLAPDGSRIGVRGPTSAAATRSSATPGAGSPWTRQGARSWRDRPTPTSSRPRRERRTGRALPRSGFCDDAFAAKLSAGRRRGWSGRRCSAATALGVRLRRRDRRAGAAGHRRHRVRLQRRPTSRRRPARTTRRSRRAFSEVFAARLAADGSRVEWATAFGGRDWDDGLGMELDAQGDVHIAGQHRVERLPHDGGRARQGLQRRLRGVVVHQPCGCVRPGAVRRRRPPARVHLPRRRRDRQRGGDRAGRRRTRSPDGRHGLAGGELPARRAVPARAARPGRVLREPERLQRCLRPAAERRQGRGRVRVVPGRPQPRRRAPA